MIASFRDKATEDVFNGVNSSEARRCCPSRLWPVARRKLDQLDSAVTLVDLRIPPGDRLEALSGPRRGQQSIRINDECRACFVWAREGPEAVDIVDYHTG